MCGGVCGGEMRGVCVVRGGRRDVRRVRRTNGEGRGVGGIFGGECGDGGVESGDMYLLSGVVVMGGGCGCEG